MVDLSIILASQVANAEKAVKDSMGEQGKSCDIVSSIDNLTGGLLSDAIAFAEDVMKTLTETIALVTKTIKEAIDLVQQTLNTIQEAINDVIQTILEEFQALITAINTVIANAVAAAAEAINGVINQIFDYLSDLSILNCQSASDTVKNLSEGVSDYTDTLKEKVTNTDEQNQQLFADAVQSSVDNISNSVNNSINTISDSLSNFSNSVIEINNHIQAAI